MAVITDSQEPRACRRTGLKTSSFGDYFIPSLFLFTVVGGSFLFAAIAVFSRFGIARVSAFAAGAIVLAWIGVQLAIIGYVSWMQPTTAIGGLLVLALARLLPPRAYQGEIPGR